VSPLFDFGPLDSSVTLPVNQPDGSTKMVTYAVPSRLNESIINVNAASGTVISGQSFSSYWSQLSSSVNIEGSADLFSGSMSANFTATTFTSDSFAYSQQQYYINQWRLIMPPPGDIATLLNPSFKSDLESMNPIDLFDTYGAFYLHSILVGGRLNYNFTTDTSVFNSQYSLASTVSFAWEGISGGSLSAEQQKAVDSLNQSSVSSLRVVGGDSAAAQQLLNNGGAAALNSWFASVAQNPVFCG
jgi:hypothetical protein